MAKIDENDDLYNLFAAFDDVSASDELKTATLAKILAGADGETDNVAETDAGKDVEEDVEENAEENAEAVVEENASGVDVQDPAIPDNAVARPDVKVVKTGADGKASRKARWRAIRVAALAACLALALTGGIAYATPVSHVDVTQDEAKISLGVNCFGVVVTADSEDEEGRAVLDSTELCNIPREESIDRAADSLETMRPERPVEIDGQPRRPVADEPPAGNSLGQASTDGMQGEQGGQDGRDGQPTGGRSGGDASAMSGQSPDQGSSPSEREKAQDVNDDAHNAPEAPAPGRGASGQEGPGSDSSQAAFDMHGESDRQDAPPDGGGQPNGQAGGQPNGSDQAPGGDRR